MKSNHEVGEKEMNRKTKSETAIDPLFRKIDCYSLPVADLDAAIAYYAELGHTPVWREGQHAAGLRLPDSDSEIVLHTGDRPAETYFLVRSVPEAIARVEKAGGRLVVGPSEIAAGLYARLQDPWNNPLVVLDLSKGKLLTDSDGNVVGNQV
jgi:predicted enzyme related to lactoylglutathione lyase